jgi:hypothetical protein
MPAVDTALIIKVNNVSVDINGDIYQLNDYINDFSTNNIARWYNEYKKFKVEYNNEFDEDDCIGYQDFINLYIVYVFDISKQSESITNGIANVNLDFNFITPVHTIAQASVNLYVVSFFDRIWSLKSDGTKQYILK